MVARIINLPKDKHFFLFGARGTGKTTLLSNYYEGSDVLYIDLLNYDTFLEFLLRPQALFEQVEGARETLSRVIIDEIQKVPTLLDVVHKLIYENAREHVKSIQYILTGSSPRKLKRGGANLLAGRAFVYHLFPFLYKELGDQFSLQSALSWGMLPEVWNIKEAKDKKEFLNAYTATYVREEILQEQLIRRLEPFQRFLPIAAQSSGSQINFSKIARDVGVSQQTVQSYFYILEDTLVGFFLPAYHPSIRKQEQQSQKFYLFDEGVTRALTRHLDIPQLQSTYTYGRAFEAFVIQQIKFLISYLRSDEALYYYRTKAGVEIDLIIEHPARPLCLIEIKSTENVSPEHTASLEQLLPDMGEAEAYCLSNDKKKKKIGNVLCYYWKEGIEKIFDKSEK
jgi:uncharacterized protein